jgi:hypothetical protein
MLAKLLERDYNELINLVSFQLDVGGEGGGAFSPNTRNNEPNFNQYSLSHATLGGLGTHLGLMN